MDGRVAAVKVQYNDVRRLFKSMQATQNFRERHTVMMISRLIYIFLVASRHVDYGNPFQHGRILVS